MTQHNPDRPWRIGIDAGSKTIKVVVLDEEGSLVHSSYQRHRTNIRETLQTIIHDLVWRKGDFEATLTVTGSAGIRVAELLSVPFVQEVVAETEAVRQKLPDTDVVVELGGEDAKVIYLTGGLEQRMNATCAGGTGGFIDTIAFMLGVRTDKMSNLAMGAQRIYPIASRCAVFAQTDVRPLLNAGASKADIAASALDAVVRQTLGGLACGRPIRGNVAFLGGPFEYVPELTNRFRSALNLDRKAGVKPQNAHLFPAMGAALLTPADAQPVLLSTVEEMLKSAPTQILDDDLPRLDPLFANEEELEAFQERHRKAIYPSGSLFTARGPVYVGFDAGSTTVKVAAVDDEGKLLYHDYRPSRGETAETLRQMILDLYAALPTCAPHGEEVPYIAQTAATGYGETMLVSGFGVDGTVVETAAHVRAAQAFCPDVSFVLDIGGQDMKALWIKNGHVSDAVLNEACSSGCGAFVEGTAYSLHKRGASFAEAALTCSAPVDLGTRCTVFMSSRVKHAQKVGASVEDIAAGVAYSVVSNALYRIIGQDRLKTLGDAIVVQGGTFKSDAILRAFERTCGVEALRPDRAHLMGAIGAALVARDRVQRTADPAQCRSGLLPKEEVAALKPKRLTKRCEGCGNQCALSILDFGEGRKLISGNRCERGAQGPVKPIDKAGDTISHDATSTSGSEASTSTLDSGAQPSPTGSPIDAPPPNLVAFEQALRAAYRRRKASEAPARRGEIRLGLLSALDSYEPLPFWYRFLEELGFSVVLPATSTSASLKATAWETVPAEAVCYPAKLAHVQVMDLINSQASVLFMACARRGSHCPVARDYHYALVDSVEPLRTGQIPFLAPLFSTVKPESIAERAEDKAVLEQFSRELCALSDTPLQEGEVERALQAGLSEWVQYQTALENQTAQALAWIAEEDSRRGVILAGRPYHNDPELTHAIDAMLTELGFAVLTPSGLRSQLASLAAPDATVLWKPAASLIKATQFVIDHPAIDLVALQSFGCGYDAVLLEEVRTQLEAAGRPFTALKVDEMVETAHLRIRLRTLAETVQATSILPAAAPPAAPSTHQSLSADASTSAAQDAPFHHTGRLLEKPLDSQDLAVARAQTIKDVCFTANIMAARALRLLEEDPSLEALILPEACFKCLNEAIPAMITAIRGTCPPLIWERAEAHPAPALPANTTPGSRPKIGLIGNPLLVFEPFLNDGIVELIERLGCDVVLPAETALYQEDVRYLDTLQEFAEARVAHVIYLQSFGCMKGHVRARGAHYEFAEQFPLMPVTVLDFDPEASALNRENRVRLIVESVLRATSC